MASSNSRRTARKPSKRLSIVKARKIARALQEEAARTERGRRSKRGIPLSATATGSGEVVFHAARVLERYGGNGGKARRRPSKKRAAH